MKKFRSLALSLIAAATLFMAGCDKTIEYPIDIPPTQAHFMNKEALTYQILTPNSTYKIPVGVTTASDVDRQITISVNSPSGAVAGVEYTINSNVITIPAGKVVDTLVIKGNLARYLNEEVDTLIFTITEPNITPSDYNKTLKLVLRGPCPIRLATYLGNWNAREVFGASVYGPYSAPITTVDSISPTSAIITVANLWDSGWEPIKFTLDWSDLRNTTATVVSDNSIAGSNAGDLSTAYAGQTVAVRPFPDNAGVFDPCNNTFTLRMQLGVTNVGFFGTLYEVKLSR